MRKLIYTLLLIAVVTSSYAQGESPFKISNDLFELKWIAPEGVIKEVGKHEKLEFGLRFRKDIDLEVEKFIRTNKDGINPFNPEDISVDFIFKSSSKKESIIYGFYYKEFKRSGEKWTKNQLKYNWRVRFSPNEIGDWKFVVKIKIKEKVLHSVGTDFKCIPSKSKGILTLKESDRYLHLSESDQPFFSVGHNIGHSAYYKLTPKKAEQHKVWLTELAESGGNFFRLELGAQNGLPDWNDCKNYNSKMPEMMEFDDLIAHSENLGLYFILFRHHTEVCDGESWDLSKWGKNPYKLAFDLKNRTEYYTNEDVAKWQKNSLRYIFSRWGYSPSFAFYEYQELDAWVKSLERETGYNTKKAIELFTEWYKGQKKYIQEELSYNKLFINTYASTPDFEYNPKSNGMFSQSDVIGFHKYGQGKEINYKDKYDKAEALWKNWNKPFLVEEMGVDAYGNSDFLPLYKCSNTPFHNSIWSTAFMGGFGTGLIWWWDRGIHDLEYYKEYKVLSEFFKEEALNKEKFEPQKWHSKTSIKRATIENYALKNEEQTRVIGWVHNATHYWRNIKSPCMEELLETGQFKKPFKLKDGYKIGGQKEVKTDFKRYADAYSNKGVQVVVNQGFDIKALKPSSVFGKSNWYEVKYYSTYTNKEVSRQVVKTNVGGKLKLKYPNTEDQDLSYKVNYLGKSKKEPK